MFHPEFEVVWRAAGYASIPGCVLRNHAHDIGLFFAVDGGHVHDLEGITADLPDTAPSFTQLELLLPYGNPDVASVLLERLDHCGLSSSTNKRGVAYSLPTHQR